MIVQSTNFGKTKDTKHGIHVNHNYPLHIHQSSELVWVIEGELKMAINGKELVGRSGDVFIIPPYHIHDQRTEGYSKIFICVFSNDFVTPIFSQDEWYTCCTGKLIHLHEELQAYLSAVFIPAVKVHYPHVKTKLPVYPRVCAGIHAILAEYATENHAPELSKSFPLSEILLYISQNYKSKITLSELSRSIGYSKSYVSHCLETIPGFNFTFFVNSMRVDYAKSLLTNTNRKSIDIALESGFSCERSFHRAFMKIVGMTPSEYRRAKSR